MSLIESVKTLERSINCSSVEGRAKLPELESLLGRFDGMGVMLPLSRRRASRLNMAVYHDPVMGWEGAPYEPSDDELDWVGVVRGVGVDVQRRRPRSYILFDDPDGYVRVYLMYVHPPICIYQPDAWEKLLVAVAKGATLAPRLMRSIGLERV
jgi:hypothetical protein